MNYQKKGKNEDMKKSIDEKNEQLVFKMGTNQRSWVGVDSTPQKLIEGGNRKWSWET